MSEKDIILKVENLTVTYGEKVAIKNVNLTVYKNDFIGVIGPNGGGKTTLIKAILGLLPIRSGRIVYEGSNTQSNIGYLPQYNVIDKKFPITVLQVILSGLQTPSKLLKRFSAKEKALAEETLIKMGLLDVAHKPIGELSGGQIQRALLGRAIIAKPQLLILDEPSTYIDRKFEAKLYEILTEINKNCAILLISHDLGSVLQQVKTIACVNETLHYHPSTEVDTAWIEKNFHCPIDIIGHGQFPHRVLKKHKH